MVSKIRQIIRRTLLKRILHIESKVNLVFLGSDYGGFYVADLFQGNNDDMVIYSFGIGCDLSFSQDALETFPCEVFAFDPTPKSVEYVKGHSIMEDRRFHFFNYAIASCNGVASFHLPKNEKHISGSLIKRSTLQEEGIEVEIKTLKCIMDELGHKRITILKLDIEGMEFELFEKMNLDDMRFDQLCLEVHDRFYFGGLFKLLKLIKKLHLQGYSIAAFSREYEELSFVKVENYGK